MKKLTKEDMLRRWKLSPYLFVTECIGATPSNQQTKVLKKFGLGSKISIRSGHGTGKTALLAWAILWFMSLRKSCRIMCTAGTKTQLKVVLWPEIKIWMDKLPKEMRDDFIWQTEAIIKKSNPQDCFAVARTARKEAPDALQGFHHEHMMSIIDEASAVPDEVFEVSEGALTKKNAICIMTGNPTRLSGEFYRSHTKDMKLWDLYHFSCLDTDMPQCEKSYAERMAQKWGTDSNIYKVRVLGEFPDQETNTFIPLHIIEAASLREAPRQNDDIMIWGVDPARYGDCEFALCKRKGQVVTYIGGQRKKSADESVDWLQWHYNNDKDKPAKIIIDEVGMGGPIGDIMRKAGMNVVFCNVTRAAKDPTYYKCRDELWKFGREFLENGGVIPNDVDLIGQLATIKYNLPNGKIVIESKDRIREDKRESPDRADAFNLTFYKSIPLFSWLK